MRRGLSPKHDVVWLKLQCFDFSVGLSSKTTDEDQIARYRSLLLGDLDAGDDKPDDVDMEITWEPDLLGDKEVVSSWKMR